MAGTPPQTEVAALVALYVAAEQQILAGFASVLARTASTVAARQAAMPKLRRVIRVVMTALEQHTDPLIEKAINGSTTAGSDQALDELSKIIAKTPQAVGNGLAPRPPAGPPARVPGSGVTGGGAGGSGGSGSLTRPGSSEPFDFSMPHTERSARAIINDLTSELQDVRFRITRLPDDVYKLLAPRGAVALVLGRGFTPEQAQAVVWRDFIQNGVTGFTDKAGRDWSMSAYTEMAVRTASQRAYNASHLATMHAAGIHLFTVPDDGHPCPLCFPWQNAVLSDGPLVVPGVHIDGTIQDATKAGLFHPNCRHQLVAFIPGISVALPRQTWGDEQDRVYKLTQKQRALELEVRKAKRVLEHALTPQARRDAAADVKDAQKRVRELVAANPMVLSRQSRREQPNLRNATTKLPELS